MKETSWKLIRVFQAQQSRQKFLNEHMVKLDRDANEDDNGGDEEQHEEKDASSSEICELSLYFGIGR